VLIVGEKINTSRREAAEAVEMRDAEAIRGLARRQTEAGAQYIDVNCGTFEAEEPELLSWLVQEVQQELDGAPLCIDSTNPKAIAAALKVHQGQALLNASYSAETARYEALEPLIKEYGCKVVAMPMDDENGMPADQITRFKSACQVIDRLCECGVKSEDIYIDPLIQPISVDGNYGVVAAETIRLVREKHPAVHAICGLSNVSFSLPERKLLNQAFMVICAASGLDTVILNPEDRGMMRMLYATEALLGHDLYCRSYLEAYRNGLL
jgi:5-methyltetrahydrofolate--homocysteine methyltransferase